MNVLQSMTNVSEVKIGGNLPSYCELFRHTRRNFALNMLKILSVLCALETEQTQRRYDRYVMVESGLCLDCKLKVSFNGVTDL